MAKTTAAQRHEHEIRALERRIVELERDREANAQVFQQTAETIEVFVEQLAELNLKLLYTMRHVRLERKTGSLILGSQQILRTNLAEMYHAQRDTFLNTLAEEMAHVEQQVAHEDAEATAAAARGPHALDEPATGDPAKAST